MRALAWVLSAVLVAFALGLAVLTLGAFASLGSGAPLWLHWDPADGVFLTDD